MIIISSINEMQKKADQLRLRGKKIGLVPTMGFLHEGHLSLVQKIKKYCDIIVMSIFVNPKQFAPDEDFKDYPRDFNCDCELAKKQGVDIIFNPLSKNIYSKPYLTYVEVDHITQVLCGASRPTHFKGVTTIVAKLFNIVNPHVVVFGQKDAQQAIVIKQMVKDLNLDIKIIIAPIIREKDGLAKSSRNNYLSSEQRKQALVLFQSLIAAEKMKRRCYLMEKSPVYAEVIRKRWERLTNKKAKKIDHGKRK